MAPHRPVKDRGLTIGGADMVAVGGEESVNVCVRLRPFNKREIELQGKNHPGELLRSVVEMPEGVAGAVRVLEQDEQTRDFKELEMFSFSKSFWSVTQEQQPHKFLPITQEDIFDVVGKVVLTNSIGGFNSCIFAYGQTGSGKTHTMMGDFRTDNSDFVGDPGLIPRMCRELFSAAARKKEEVEKENPRLKLDFDIKLSALEIYNEHIKDLFWKGSSFAGRQKDTVLKIRHHPTEGPFVDQLTVFSPKTWETCLKMIADGVGERTVAATLMNSESSRSHSVFIIVVQQTESLGPPPEDVARRFEKPVVTTKMSRINLVDLAGSERLKKSGAQGQQLKEAAGINQSLSTLKKVIDALVDNSKLPPKRQLLVPYRESALTLLLQHSLGGNSKTTMIACISPHHDNLEESLNTLRYAARAKGIVNHVKANEDNAAKQAMLLREQILALQQKLLEGPAEHDEQSMAELRDQLEVGQRAMREREEEQRRKEAEAARMSELYHSQKNARFAASYYNSFKRVLLQHVRDLSEMRMQSLETELRARSVEKESLSAVAAEKERAGRESQYTMEELKRKNDLSQIKSARNEAMARQLVRDIAKAKKRAEENLSTRYGLVWVRNKHEKNARQTLEQQKEAMRKDNELYLQSIVREAKKQFESLTATYAEREAAQSERLATMERGRAHAQAQLERADQLVFSLRASLERLQADHRGREAERTDAWSRRYSQMQRLYEEKVFDLTSHVRHTEEAWPERQEAARRETARQFVPRLQELHDRRQRVDADGAKKVAAVEAGAAGQQAELLGRIATGGAKARADLVRDFQHDEATLHARIVALQGKVIRSRASLEELFRYALQLDSTAKLAVSALQRHPVRPSDPVDVEAFKRTLVLFRNSIQKCHFDFPKVSAVLKKPIAGFPQAPATL